MAAAAVHPSERISRASRPARLFIGAGEMIELCAAHFCGEQPRKVTIANRTAGSVLALAARFGADVIRPTRWARCCTKLRHRGVSYRQPAAHHRPRHGRARASARATARW